MAHRLVLIAVVPLALCLRATAAPVESVESARATAAIQKIDSLLAEKAVARQLAALGINRRQVDARLAQLSEAQLEQLAAQAETIRAGGTVQCGNVNPLGPLGCMWQELRRFMCDLYHLVFCWGPSRYN